MQNSVKTKPKQSDLERKMQSMIYLVFGAVLIFCMIASLFYIVWYRNNIDLIQYIELGTLDLFQQFFIRVGNWVLIFGNFVPISLLVTIESVKFVQAIFISRDEKMYTKKCDSKVLVQSSNLNEELGQISYVFSDKTGTLTCNEMIFKKCIVEGKAFGNQENPSFVKGFPVVSNVNFSDKTFFQPSTKYEETQNALFCKFLSICHMIIVNENDGELTYNSPSPDEIALANFARFSGSVYKGMDKDGMMVVEINGKDCKFNRKYILEFNSDRKRQSVIFEDGDDIWLYTKGADNIMLGRCDPKIANTPEMNNLKKHLDNFAREGLRTLVLGIKKINPQTWKSWNKKYEEALNMIKGRRKRMEQLQAEIETDLYVFGATAIEDRLQDEVPETIAQLKRGGIKVWVLTGDKIETAKTIGYSCNLLQPGMINYDLIINTKRSIINTLNIALKEISETMRLKEPKKRAIIVSGAVLTVVFADPRLEIKFNDVAQACEAVLCCRVSPLQKQQVVKMVQKCVPLACTLSIGDGANDVQMITAAHVGVGIKGVEGQQASRASDYGIGEFKHLRRLVFFYGRDSYRKNSILVLYSFYKNIVLVLPQFWYAIFYNNASGVTLYDAFLYQLVNIIFTSAPITIYAILDRDTEEDVLEFSHRYYFPGPRCLLFNSTVFWQWFAFGCFQSIFITVICAIANFSPQADGTYLGFWGYGILVFFCTILIPNLKVLTFTNSFHFLNIFVLVGSVFLFLVSFLVISMIPTNPVYGSFFKILFNWKTIVILSALIVTTYHIDNMWVKFQYSVFFAGAQPPTHGIKKEKNFKKREGNNKGTKDTIGQ